MTYKVSSQSVFSLDLSVRTTYCLQRAGITTIEQLVAFSEDDLRSLRDGPNPHLFRPQTIREIKEQLAEVGLTLTTNH